MDGIGGRAGWAWIFIIVCYIKMASYLAEMSFPGRIVHDLYGSRWVLSYTFNSKRLQIPHFSAERVRVTSYSVEYL